MSMSGSQTSFGLWIINKAGGLIYSRTYADGLAQLNSNDYLILASTFHSIHAIASRLSPVPGSSGVETIEAETFKMTCLQTPTGIKFVLLTTPSHPSPETVLRRIYETYADHLKDPFYTVEMPIRSETFDSKMHVAVDKKLAALPISIAYPPVPRASSPSLSSSFSYLSPARLPPRRPTPPPPLDGKDLDDVPLTPRFTPEDPFSPISPTPSWSSCAPSARPPPRARGEDRRWSNSSFGTARVSEQKAGESARTFKTQAGNTLTIQSKNPYLGRI